MISIPRFAALAAILLAPPALTGCFSLGGRAATRADKETYPIITQKQDVALGRIRDFTIDPVLDPFTEKVLSESGQASDQFSSEGYKISLAEMLALVLYTGCDSNYAMCAAERGGDYATWPWFSFLLHWALSKLPTEEGTVYSGRRER